mgnify:CR=1 FL=1
MKGSAGGRQVVAVLAASLIVVTLLAGFLGYSYLVAQSEYQNLKSEYQILATQVTSLRNDQSQLQLKLEKLQTNAPSVNVSEDQVGVGVFEAAEASLVFITNKQQGLEGLAPVASGSGFTYDLYGHIITNNHVVEGADAVDVTFPDGTVLPAEVVGTDPYSDVAVLKVDASSILIKPIVLGDSSKIAVGQRVFALGNPFRLRASMTEGIVSQIDRELQTEYGYLIIGVIQVDAAINPGNSGGPLLDINAEVIGVNTAIESTTGEFSGVGFAIPINMVKRVANSIIATGKFEHPWVGMSGMDVTPAIANAMGLTEPTGFLLTGVISGSPADRAGMKAGTRQETVEGVQVNLGGDVIIAVDGQAIKGLYDALTYIEGNRSPGDEVVFTIMRDGKTQDIHLTLGVRPPPQ